MAFSDDAPVHLLGKKSSSKRPSSAGWRVVGKQKRYFRSRWEHNFACYLEWLRTNQKTVKWWKHEPKTFWFKKIQRGCRSYKPDFQVKFSNGLTSWYEVKGWMDPKSVTKIRRMNKYHPEIELNVIDKQWFKDAGILSKIVPGWEIK